MKVRHIIFGVIMLLCTGCHTPTREARRMVKRAEQLASTQPDSAVRLIDSVLRMEAYLNERERMEMALLQGEALFGNRDANEISPIMDDDFFEDHPNISTSPELERASAYYAKKKQYGKAAHAALYSGFVQQHYNEKETAMRSFKEAEQYGDLAGDSLSMAQAKYRMGRMLLDNIMKEEALSMFSSADECVGKHFVEKAIIQNTMGICFMLQRDFDNATTYLQHSLSNAEKYNSSKICHKVLNNFAVLYRLQGRYDQALGCLHRMLEEPSLEESEIFMLNLNLGIVFFDKKEFDSASLYYNNVEKNIHIESIQPKTRLSAYAALSEFAKSQNHDSLALLYRKNHEDVLYAVMQQRQEQNIYRIQRQYDYESIQNEMNKRIIHRHRIILVISILLFISSAIIIALQYRHKQMMASEKEMKKQIEAMKHDLRQTVKSHVIDQEIASRLRMMLAAHRTTTRVKDFKNDWKPLVNQVMNGKENLFEAARSSIENIYPNLFEIIIEKHPNLSETEAKVCLLSFYDLSNAEIAEFLELRLNTVNQNRSTLRKKLNLKHDRMKEQLRNVITD